MAGQRVDRSARDSGRIQYRCLDPPTRGAPFKDLS